MPSSTFRITYKDPISEEQQSVIMTFEDGPQLTARDQAEDLAYTRADKGWYEIKELQNNKGAA